MRCSATESRDKIYVAKPEGKMKERQEVHVYPNKWRRSPEDCNHFNRVFNPKVSGKEEDEEGEYVRETREQNFSKSEENNVEVYGIVVTSRQGEIFSYFKYGSEAAGRGGGV